MYKVLSSVLLYLCLSLPFLEASYLEYINAYFKPSHEPIQVTKLQGGLSGAEIYKVTVDHSDYVLRILNAQSLPARKNEVEAAIYAGNRGIGPCIFYAAENYQAIIMEYVHGKTLSGDLLSEKAHMKALLHTLKQLHKSTGDFPKAPTVFQKIRANMSWMTRRNIPLPVQAVKRALAKLELIEKNFSEEPLVPTHHDLNALNVIFNGEAFKFIDWTDASMGYAYYDLGYFLLVNNISEMRFPEILESYLGKAPSAKELSLLKQMKEVAMLRLFGVLFSSFESPAFCEVEKMQRSLELEDLVAGEMIMPLEEFFLKHMLGEKLHPEFINQFALSALQTFLSESI